MAKLSTGSPRESLLNEPALGIVFAQPVRMKTLSRQLCGFILVTLLLPLAASAATGGLLCRQDPENGFKMIKQMGIEAFDFKSLLGFTEEIYGNSFIQFQASIESITTQIKDKPNSAQLVLKSEKINVLSLESMVEAVSHLQDKNLLALIKLGGMKSITAGLILQSHITEAIHVLVLTSPSPQKRDAVLTSLNDDFANMKLNLIQSEKINKEYSKEHLKTGHDEEKNMNLALDQLRLNYESVLCQKIFENFL